MKKIFLLIFLHVLIATTLQAQNDVGNSKQQSEIYALIDLYSKAREKQDTVMLKSILTADVDQLVSSGEWRSGVKASIKGMLQSSGSNAGSRSLTVDKIRFINSGSAIVDARYEIQTLNGATRKMWSTFIVVYAGANWKISAIRNMLPAGQ